MHQLIAGTAECCHNYTLVHASVQVAESSGHGLTLARRVYLSLLSILHFTCHLHLNGGLRCTCAALLEGGAVLQRALVTAALVQDNKQLMLVDEARRWLAWHTARFWAAAVSEVQRDALTCRDAEICTNTFNVAMFVWPACHPVGACKAHLHTPTRCCLAKSWHSNVNGPLHGRSAAHSGCGVRCAPAASRPHLHGCYLACRASASTCTAAKVPTCVRSLIAAYVS